MKFSYNASHIRHHRREWGTEQCDCPLYPQKPLGITLVSRSQIPTDLVTLYPSDQSIPFILIFYFSSLPRLSRHDFSVALANRNRKKKPMVVSYLVQCTM